jgi:pyruvate dehydrogenase E1 component
MTFDAFLQQLPDADPDETAEWLESLDNLVATEGASRARYVIG